MPGVLFVMKMTREEWTLDQLIRALSDLKTDYGGDTRVYIAYVSNHSKLKEVGYVEPTYDYSAGIILES